MKFFSCMEMWNKVSSRYARITKYGTYIQGQTVCTEYTHLYDGVLLSLKKKAILTHTTTWMDLEDILSSRVSRSQKDKHCSIASVWGPQRSHHQEAEEWVPGAAGGAWKLVLSGDRVSVGEDEKIVVTVEQQCEGI